MDMDGTQSKVGDTELPCPIHVKSQCIIHLHVNVFANQEASLSLGIQSVCWGFITEALVMNSWAT